jgi:hypothetical protein
MVSLNTIAPVYRYFTTDIVSNTLLAEIPFKGVSFGRALKGAGEFSGKIPVIDKTASFDLYDSTMPGKTALYVTRDGECVWGGIIWSRNYNLKSRELDVSASEFTSYFHRRRVWKTWSHDLGATVVVSGSVGTVTLDPGFTYSVKAGSSVKLSFREVKDFAYIGYYTISAAPAPTPTTFRIDAAGIPAGTYPLTTITVNTDTYDWVRSLIDSVLTDFTNLEFSNSEIEPGVSDKITVTSTQVAGGFATLNCATAHNVNPGQIVVVRNIDSTYNGQYIVTDTPNATQLKFAKTGTVALQARTVKTATITQRQLTAYVATLTTSAAHGFAVGNQVVVSNVDPGSSLGEIFNGEYIITSVTSNTFSYLTSSIRDQTITAVASGTATVTPYVLSGSYGPYTANSDIGGLDYSDEGYSGVDLDPQRYRGYELVNVGEELDRYSDRLSITRRRSSTPGLTLNRVDGFEYRIDCEYDPNTASFKRIFVLLPINFPDPPAEGEVSPISRFGADQLVFEYPGQISDFSLDEKSDDAVTRFWVVGDIGDLGADASQPYSAASAVELMLDGWPILEDDHSEKDEADEEVLFDIGSRYLSEYRPPIGDISVSVNGSLAPVVGTYAPGDWCSLVIDDEFVKMRLASDLEPRDTAIVRKIDSISISVPDTPTFPEKVTLKLIPEWEVDKRG